MTNKVVQDFKPLSGWLKKKGEGMGALFYKKRFFRQEKTHLFYFRADDDPIEFNLGNIDLNEVTSVHPTAKSDAYAFQVNTLNRVYYLCAGSAYELDYWVTGLVRFIKVTGIEEKLDKQLVASDPAKFMTLGKPGGFQHVAGWDENNHEVKTYVEGVNEQIAGAPDELKLVASSPKPVRKASSVQQENENSPNFTMTPPSHPPPAPPPVSEESTIQIPAPVIVNNTAPLNNQPEPMPVFLQDQAPTPTPIFPPISKPLPKPPGKA